MTKVAREAGVTREALCKSLGKDGGPREFARRLDGPCAVIYRLQMIEVRQTTGFRGWLDGLKDGRARERIAQRIVRLQAGLFGDAKFFDGIGELRVDHGPGYRVYFARRGPVVVILLCGGDKATQRRDIERAKVLASGLED